jgi:hypothetical protein
MLTRRTTRVLADLCDLIFSERTYKTEFPSSRGVVLHRYKLRREALYDFLFERDYDAWFLNAVKSLPGHSRALTEFIMGLHTGETVPAATANSSPEQRSERGQMLLTHLAQDALLYAASLPPRSGNDVRSQTSELASLLELDGYLFRDGKLYYTEAAVLDTEAEEGILEKLIGDLGLDNSEVMKHHLELSETDYLEGRWDDSIGNSRKFLESVLQEAAAKHHLSKTRGPIGDSTYSRPGSVRKYLQAQGLIGPKEKEAVSAAYGLLSETGGHPHIAQKDQARLMRHLALTFAQFALLRLQGALNTQ